jgi:hypothetical protein
MGALQDTRDRFHNCLMWFRTQELLVWGDLSRSCRGQAVVQQVPALEVEVVIRRDIALASGYFGVVDQMHEAGWEGWGLSQAIN